MGRLSDLIFEMVEDIEAGELSFREIAQKYDVPASFVDEVWQGFVKETESN